jgi:hypothetical protein
LHIAVQLIFCTSTSLAPGAAAGRWRGARNPAGRHKESGVTARPRAFIAIQIGAISFVDEGVNQVLDILQEKACVNALLLANPTWTRGTGGRQVPGQPFPDHGKQEPDDFHGGAYNRLDPRYYAKTTISADYRHTDPEIPPDFDLFEAVLPEAERRGMRSYAWMEESSTSRDLHRLPNFPKALEVDIYGRPSNRPCFNIPD